MTSETACIENPALLRLILTFSSSSDLLLLEPKIEKKNLCRETPDRPAAFPLPGDVLLQADDHLDHLHDHDDAATAAAEAAADWGLS